MLEIKNLSKTFDHDGRSISIIQNISLVIEKNQFVVFLGPSGCGKTTFLKLLAGLMTPTSGEIFLEGKKIKGPGKERGIVFQHYSLFPWLTVYENIAFSLHMAKLESHKKAKIIEHYLEITGLKEYRKFYPKNLSGGMQQRVAIARTLASNPTLLLMDEPFGSLDAQMREQMQDFLIKLYEEEHKTVIFITHDVTEALLMADIIYVMSTSPMQIKNRFDVSFKRPRDHRLKYTNGFFEMEKKIAKEIS